MGCTQPEVRATPVGLLPDVGRGIGQTNQSRYVASSGNLMKAVDPLLRKMHRDTSVCM